MSEVPLYLHAPSRLITCSVERESVCPEAHKLEARNLGDGWSRLISPFILDYLTPSE